MRRVTLVILLFAVLIIISIYLRHRSVTGEMAMLELFIKSHPSLAIVIGVTTMAAFSVSPIPAELWLVTNIKLFGNLFGFFYSWIGILLGGLVLFSIGRLFRATVRNGSGRTYKWLRVLENPNRSQLIVWLLMARLLPIPFKLVSLVAGASSQVRIVDFLWTTGLGVLPYNFVAILIWNGVVRSHAVISVFYLSGGALTVWVFRKALRTAWQRMKRYVGLE